MLKSMIGKFGHQSGIEHSRRCQCGASIVGEGELCADCWVAKNQLWMGECLIQNSPGRCPEYFTGECEKCLGITAEKDWNGWRRIRGNKHKIILSG